MSDFGILTLATRSDCLKAIGLALSLRVSNPGVKTAVACHPDLAEILEPFFDFIVEEKAGLKGFAHKVYLDRYTPFQTTFFFDSDVFVFKSILDVVLNWPVQAYTAAGNYVTGGISPFGLDRAKVLKRLGVNQLVHIDGAGHALFRKPECISVFDRAREITENYKEYGYGARYADEDVMNIVMTEKNLVPVSREEGFFSRYLTARPGTMNMSVKDGRCRYVHVKTGKLVEPVMMHFAADEAPLIYTAQLWHLFKHFGVPTKGLARLAYSDWFNRYPRLYLHNLKKRLL